jgi:glyoxylase-like metal-dependent hydrolase (beta-lactamase superfamily II)
MIAEQPAGPGGPYEDCTGIHRIGDQSIVNAYLLEDAGEVTIIDAGVPGYYRDIPWELDAMGRSVTDVCALLLTHGIPTHRLCGAAPP